MDPTKPHPRRRSSPPAPTWPTSHIMETELDLDPIITNQPSVTAASPTEPVATIAHTGDGDTHVAGMDSRGARSPSSSSEGSSSGFVKVEHSDVPQSAGLIGSTAAPIRMEQLMRLHDVDDNEEQQQQRQKESKMDHGFGSEEPHSGILPRAQEFAESAFGKVTDAASTGAEKVAHGADAAYRSAADAASSAIHSTRDAAEGAAGVLGDTIHLAGDTLGDAAHHVGDRAHEAYQGFTDISGEAVKGVEDRAHQAYEGIADASRDAMEAARGFGEKAGNTLEDTARHVSDRAQHAYEGFADASRDAVEVARGTASDMFTGAAHGISDTAQSAHDMAADAAHTMKEDADKAMDTVAGGLSGAAHTIRDTAHHAADTFGDAMYEAKESAKGAGDTGAASGAVHSAEDAFADLGHKIKDSVPHSGDLFSNTDLHGAVKSAQEDLIGLADEASDAAKRAFGGAGHDVELDKPGQTGGDHAAGQPAQQWGSDWGRYGAEIAGAATGAVHAGEDTIRNEIADVHDQVDSLIEKMHSAGTPQHDIGAAEESTFDRRGPLTIPHQTPGDALRLDDDMNSSKHGGFEVSPRPPTPPKELDDEDVKPTTIDVGQPAHKPSTIGEPRSILKHSGQGSRFNLKWMDSRMLDLLYWRDPKKSGAVLGVTVLTLLVFAKFPLVAVLSYLGLAILGGTLGFRIYKLIEAQIKKTDGGNPFQPYLNREFHVPQEKVHQQVDVLIEHAQLIGNELRRLFLVENILDSVKFGLLLWALTYVSSWFSGLCLLILFVLAIFTIPKVYEVYQEPIDRNVSVAKQHVDNVTKKINEKVPPFLKKSTAAAGDANHEKTN